MFDKKIHTVGAYQAMGNSIKAWPQAFYRIWWVVLLLFASSYGAAYVIEQGGPLILRWATLIGSYLADIYLWGLAILMVDSRFDSPLQTNVNNLYLDMLKRLFPSLTAVAVTAITAVLVLKFFILIAWLFHHYLQFDTTWIQLSVSMGVGLVLTFVFVLFFMTVPLIILKGINIPRAFKLSAYLVGPKWPKCFAVYMVLVVLMLFTAMPASQFARNVITNWHYTLCDLAFLIIAAPVFVNLLLIILHDMVAALRNDPSVG